MITKTKSYQTSDGKIFGSIPEAQAHEVRTLATAEFAPDVADKVAVWACANCDKLVDILTTKGSSKPAARAVNGGTKKRTPKPQSAPAPKLEAA